jgi:hypothetical protein
MLPALSRPLPVPARAARARAWRAPLVGLLVSASVLLAGPAGAQVTWTPRGPLVPIARVENAMVYDSVNQRMVNFGGYDIMFNRMNDMWEYNGAARTWVNVTPAVSPPRRQGSAMAYDPNRQRILLFGGSDDAGTVLGDTWEWNAVAKSWTQLSPSPAPSPRVGSRMVYDVANDRIILHGGWNSTTTQHFADTWAWNPTNRTWNQLSPTASPSARTYHGLVYNTSNNRVTIFGGVLGGVYLNDLWELQGNTWVNVTPGGAAPQGRAWSGVTYESANGRLLIHAGWSGSFSFQDTWAWNGSSWTQLANGPTPRDSHQMVWDPNRGASVVFGGADADVPEFAGNAWILPPVTRWPPEQDEHSIAFDPLPPTLGGGALGHRRMFLYGGGDAISRVWETNNFDNLTWRSPNVPVAGEPPTAGPGGRIGHAMVYDPLRPSTVGRIIIFGGRQRTNGVLGATVFGDTWIWSRQPGQFPAAWVNAGGGPPARYDHDMVYDAARDRIVLFGGRNAAGTPFGDTWLWNGSSWSQAAGGPSARFGHSLAYDNTRGVVILFGGDNGSGGKLGDTWEWNGTSWTQRATTGPSPRDGGALSWFGGACGGVLLFGGRDQAGTLLNDHWIWSGTSWVPASFGAARPSARVNARMSYDTAAQRLWLYGGLTAGGRSGELWTATVGGAAGFSINDVSMAEGNSGTTNMVFTVSLSPPGTGASVNFATANGTATAGSDYTAMSGTLSFGSCQGAATVSVPVVGDLAFEADETFTVNLSGSSGPAIADGQGLGIIVNDDTMPQLTVNDVTVVEGTGGTTNAVFTISAFPTPVTTATVNFATANGSATAPGDYTATSGTRTFLAGQATQTVSVPIVTDGTPELDESFTLNLSGPSNATIADGQGVGTIVNDDVPAVSVGDVTVTEGDTGAQDAVFTVTLSQPAPFAARVDYGVASGTATAGVDFGTVAGTVSFPAGNTTQTVAVPVLGDFVDEPTETFFVNLSGPVSATIGDGQGQGSIQDNDAPGLSIADIAVKERFTPATATATFTVTLSPTSASTVTVNWATGNGTATAGSDYVAGAGTLTFNPGAATQTIAVTVNPDALVEGMETFVVTLSGASGSPISRPQATARILDPPGGADFNGDRLTDILWRHDVSGENVLWFMNGANLITGTFTTPSALTDVRWKMVGTNDFNQDGRPDILWRHNTSGENVLWFMNGSVLVTGTFLTPAALTDVRWGMAGTGDFNLDGRPDILWRHNVSGEIVVWFMSGSVLQSGTFLTPSAFADVNWQTVGTGDFNSDGKTDILWRHALSGQNVVWFLEGTSLVSGAFTNPPVLADTRWRMSATGDYNNDGKVDIVWRHSESGQNVIWFMDGINLISGTFTNPASLPDTNWKIVGPR